MYKLIDRQGSMWEKERFATKDEARDALRNFHSADVEGAETMDLETLLDIGYWDLVELKKYNVCVTELNYGSVNVMAENEEDAKDQAKLACDRGMGIFANGEYETGSVTLITGACGIEGHGTYCDLCFN